METKGPKTLKQMAIAIAYLSFTKAVQGSGKETKEEKLVAVDRAIVEFEAALAMFGFKIVEADAENFSEEIPDVTDGGTIAH